MKNFCPIHCFHYTGPKCPFCENDRIASYAHKYAKIQEEKPIAYPKAKKPAKPEEPKEVTTEMLAALADKFNNVTFKKH